MKLEKKLNEIDDRTWQLFTAAVQLIFILAILVFVVVAFQTRAQVNEFERQVSQGNCTGIEFQNLSKGRGLNPDDLVIQNNTLEYSESPGG